MIRRNSAYSYGYVKARRELLASGPSCVSCGRPADSADHVPPLRAHVHREGSGCCSLVASCMGCQRRQGARIANALRRARRRAPGPSRVW